MRVRRVRLRLFGLLRRTDYILGSEYASYRSGPFGPDESFTLIAGRWTFTVERNRAGKGLLMQRTTLSPPQREGRTGSAVPEFKSGEDIRQYVKALASRRADDDARVNAWHVVKRLILIATVAGSFYAYYMFWVVEQIIALPTLNFPACRPSP